MQPNNKGSYQRITKNTTVLYIRMLFSMIVSLYTSRVVLNTLGVEDYGIYNVVGGIVVLFGFFNNAMSASTQRFLTFELDRGSFERLRSVFGVSVTLHSIIALIIFILAETIGLWFLNTQINIPFERIEAANWVYQFSIFSFIITVITVPYSASIISHEKMSFYAYLGIIEVILKLLIVFILTYGNYDKLKFYAMLTFIVILIIRFTYVLYCRKEFNESKSGFLWDKELFRSMGSFANWNLLGVFAGIGYNQGVNILLNIFFGPTINAARGITFQVQGAVNNFVSSFQTAVNPPIVKAYATNNISFLYNLVFTSSKASFFLLFIISLPVMINTEEILTLWLKNPPDYSTTFTRLILCDILVGALSGSIHTLVQATGNIKKYQLLVSGILLLNLPLSYLFLKMGYPPQITFIIS
ncbi:lipopolysaccharide biosynthesis protein, partial [Bacteroidales bacterium OttesenSCG-928-A17]|nr:lipopolysaccharide biosynthesis protein [Bacteroidales bacterium OttesenSCG-928-A17]